VLVLRWETPEGWAARMAEHPLEVLGDHAHCELQAAAAAQSLIQRNPGHGPLADKLSVLAIEELRHFRRVTALLSDLGGELGPARPNLYADGLRRAAGPTCGPALLDRLLMAGLIELRSHERFGLMAGARWPDARIPALFRELEPSEAGHGRLFWELASSLFPAQVVQRRADELAALEADVLRELPFAPRVHSGLAD
jgi:tRNA-(ms[2]io[6]A)-hydroxylase